MSQSWGLQKVLALKQSVRQLLYDGLRFVGKSEVNEAAVYLGLLDEQELEDIVEEGDREKVTDHLFSPGLVSAAVCLLLLVTGLV